MRYEVIGLDENLNVVNAIIHRTGIYNDGDICKDIEGDFYLRYICPLDTKTEKRSDRAIVLKEPLQNIKYIICNNKYEPVQKESEVKMTTKKQELIE